MVVDYKRVDAGGQGALPGMLWIAEQIPGMTQRQDVTPVFISNGGFWRKPIFGCKLRILSARDVACSVVQRALLRGHLQRERLQRRLRKAWRCECGSSATPLCAVFGL